MLFQHDTPLALRCTMRVGGTARLSASPKNAEELASVIAYCKQNNIRYMPLGNGSDVVFSDGVYDGCVIFLSEMQSIEIDGNVIKAGAGASLGAVATAAQKHGLSGFEYAYGIPGSIGGAVFMNASAYGGETSSCFTSCTAVDTDGKVVVLTKADMDFGYRHSVLQQNGYIVCDATFALADGDAAIIKQTMDANMASRRAKQPLEYPSSGSAFKRPTNNFAGALIEQAGLKGYTVGGAQISEKHAGFIINIGGATATDVINLSKYVQKVVNDKFGVMLEPEIIFVD